MNAGVLKLIRAAMLSGMFMICIIIGYLVEYENFEPGIEVPAPLVMNALFLIISLVAITAMIVLRNKLEASTFSGNKGPLILGGWVVAEGVALFGAVIYLMTSNWVLFLAGFLVLLMAFLFLSIPESMDHT